jgi:hypothetical protein
MNRDDIIRMAREAGLHIATDHDWMPIIALAYAQKFAELVRAAEREACAKRLDAVGCDHCAENIRLRDRE